MPRDGFAAVDICADICAGMRADKYVGICVDMCVVMCVCHIQREFAAVDKQPPSLA